MKCKNCSYEMQPGQTFCANCGEKAGNLCPQCGEGYEGEAKFCPNCGFSFQSMFQDNELANTECNPVIRKQDESINDNIGQPENPEQSESVVIENLLQKDETLVTTVCSEADKKKAKKSQQRIAFKFTLLIAFIAFFFPFCTVSCANQEIVSSSGYALAGDWGLSLSQLEMLEVTSADLASSLIVYTLLVMVLAFLDNRGIWIGQVQTGIAAVLLFCFKEQEELIQLSDVGCYVKMEFGYWLALIMLCLASLTFIWAAPAIRRIENKIIAKDDNYVHNLHKFRDKANRNLSIVLGIVIVIAAGVHMNYISSWSSVLANRNSYQSGISEDLGSLEYDFSNSDISDTPENSLNQVVPTGAVRDDLEETNESNRYQEISVSDIFLEDNIVCWGNDSAVYIIPVSSRGYEGFYVSLGPNIDSGNTILYGLVTSTTVTDNGGIMCTAEMSDYISDEYNGILEVTWDSFETMDYPTVSYTGGMDYLFYYDDFQYYGYLIEDTDFDLESVPENIGYILPDSDSRYINENEITSFDKATLRLARNEIYARHGRKFETEDLNQYFSSQSWYYGYLSADEFDESILNGYEKANLDLIKRVENGA